MIWLAMAAFAAPPACGGPINLATAGSFALLGGTITQTGAGDIINGNVGATTTITQNSPWTVNGTVYAAGNATAVAAYNDFKTAFISAMALAPNQSCSGGNQLTANCTFIGNSVYSFTDPNITTTSGINLTFDAQNNPNENFIIRTNGAFTANGALTFTLQNQAQASNIFWIIGTDATISVGTQAPITFDGDILAGQSFTMSAASGGSGTLTGTINGCVFAETANTLAGTTNVGGCSGGAASVVPEPGSSGLVSLGCLMGILAWRKFRFECGASSRPANDFHHRPESNSRMRP
jgi:type VI secretion system secreted protein VgrG